MGHALCAEDLCRDSHSEGLTLVEWSHTHHISEMRNWKAERMGRTIASDGTAKAGLEQISTSYGSSPKEE